MLGPGGPRGSRPLCKVGVAHLQCGVGVAWVPVGLALGVFWPRRALRRLPGTIVVEFLPPIPPGLDKETFQRRLQNDIETATARLIAEGEAELVSLGVQLPRQVRSDD